MKESLVALRNPYRNGREILKRTSLQTLKPKTTEWTVQSPRTRRFRENTHRNHHGYVGGQQLSVHATVGYSGNTSTAKHYSGSVVQWGTFPSAAFGGVQGQPQFWPWPFMTYAGPPCFAPMPPTQGPSANVRPGPPDDLRSSNAVQHPFVMGPMAGLPYQQQYVSPPQRGRPVGYKVTRGLYSRSMTAPM